MDGPGRPLREDSIELKSEWTGGTSHVELWGTNTQSEETRKVKVMGREQAGILGIKTKPVLQSLKNGGEGVGKKGESSHRALGP